MLSRSAFVCLTALWVSLSMAARSGNAETSASPSPSDDDYAQSKSDVRKSVESSTDRPHVVSVKPVTGPPPSTSSSLDPSGASSMGVGIQFNLFQSAPPAKPQRDAQDKADESGSASDDQ